MKQAENEMLTRVGRGTPAGELLRRYWHPVSAVGELTEEKPIKRVTVLGEKLVVFRLPLAPGENGSPLRPCRRAVPAPQGFAVSTASSTAKASAVPITAGNTICRAIAWRRRRSRRTGPIRMRSSSRAYPVKKLGGLLFAYMGPAPAPELPRWDVPCARGRQALGHQ